MGMKKQKQFSVGSFIEKAIVQWYLLFF